jgi:ABC-type nitrate/sulfonate/bicarbonate transport system ATPase subunit
MFVTHDVDEAVYLANRVIVRRDNQDEKRATIRMRMRRRWGDEGRARLT